jgi:hypothetical protein
MEECIRLTQVTAGGDDDNFLHVAGCVRALPESFNMATVCDNYIYYRTVSEALVKCSTFANRKLQDLFCEIKSRKNIKKILLLTVTSRFNVFLKVIDIMDTLVM